MIKRLRDITFIIICLFLVGCEKNASGPERTESRLVLRMSDRLISSSATSEELVAGMRLFLFEQSLPNVFSEEIYTLTRTERVIDAWIRTGSWQLVLVSPLGTDLSAPNTNQPISSQKMFQYAPVITDGVSSRAPELFYNRILKLPEIHPDGEYAVNTVMARNVALVKVFFEKESGVDLTAQHFLKLHNVPKALNWAGGLYPDKNNPDVLVNPLEGGFAFSSLAGDPGFSRSNELVFIIPAHRGNDFWLEDGVTLNPNPVDTTTHKMSLSVNLKYTDGSTFSISNKEIPIVPRCNAITELKLKVGKTDVEITTVLKPWGEESINGDLSVPFLNISKTYITLSDGERFRVYFWTNQQTNLLVEPQGRLDDPISGTSFNVLDLFEDMENKPGNLNFSFDPATGSGYFDITNTQTVPGATRYYVYFNANGIRRAIEISIVT